MIKIMNLSTVLLTLVLTTVVATGTPTVLAEKSRSESPEYQHGYKDGAVQAGANINSTNGFMTISVYLRDIQCQPSWSAEYCSGYKAGYAAELSEQLALAEEKLGPYAQGFKEGFADAKSVIPIQGLTTDNIDCQSPNNLSGQDSIQYCKGYEDGFVGENNALLNEQR
jgi:hypothetical protein